MSNGDLLDVAESDGYDLLITTDHSIRYQQNLAGRRLAVIALLSQSWPYAESSIEEIRTVITEVQPGELREIRVSKRREA